MIVDEKTALELLKSGKVIGVPTDTVYGLAALHEYESKLFEVKKRDSNKKIVTLIDTIEKSQCEDKFLLNEMEKNWPGSVTYIYKVKDIYESFRIPNEDNLLSLLKKIPNGLKVTSANITGHDPCITKEEFEETFPQIHLLDEKIECKKEKIPSSIFKYTEHENLERIR